MKEKLCVESRKDHFNKWAKVREIEVSRAWRNDEEILVRSKALKRKWFLVYLNSWVEFNEGKSKYFWDSQKIIGRLCA